MYWKYESPIILKSSENAKIKIHCPDGNLDCSWAFLTVKVISAVE